VATHDIAPRPLGTDSSSQLNDQWRRLTRTATAVALLTSPVAFAWFHEQAGLSILWSLVATFFTVIAFRGLVDITLRRFIPWPSLFGSDDTGVREEDVVARRRAWFWRFWLRFAIWAAIVAIPFYLLGKTVGSEVLLGVLPLLVIFPAFLLAPEVETKLVLLGVLGFANAGWYSILKARLYSEMRGQSGTVMAVGTASGLVAAVLPLLLGRFADRYGLAPMMWLLLLGPVAVLVGILTAPRAETDGGPGRMR